MQYRQIELSDLLPDLPPQVGETVYFAEGNVVKKAVVTNTAAPRMPKPYITVRTRGGETYYIARFYRDKKDAAEQVRIFWSGNIKHK